MKKLFTLFVIGLFTLNSMAKTIYYVKTDGNDSNEGTAWETAFATLAKANSMAVGGDEVRIAAGTYTFSAYQRIEKSYNLRGSYNAQGVQDYSAKTIFDGNNATRILLVSNSGGVQITVGLDGISFRNANSTGNSGAACFDKSIGIITNCEFINNHTANYNGGGLAFLNAKDVANVISNCLFTKNSGIWGGALFAGSNEIVKVTNCTFANNTAIGGTAPQGGAIFCNGFLTFANNIVYGNIMGEVNYQIANSNATTATINANTNIIQNSLTGYAGTITYANDATTDAYDGDPLFVDFANGNFHLQSTSPAVDFGNGDLVPAGITTDLDGKPRFFNDLVDLGCFEYQTSTGIQPVEASNLFHAYFNSSTGYLFVDLKSDVQNIFISDLTGKKLISQNVAKGESKISINVSHLSKGVYLLNSRGVAQKVMIY